MKLYEITADYQNLLEAIANGEIPEEAIADTLESVTALLEDKADNIACLIKNLMAEAEAIKAEEDKLKARRTAKLNRAERLTNYLSDTLLQSGNTKIETARNVITFRKTPPKVVFDDEKAFLSWAIEHAPVLLNIPRPTNDRTAVKNAIAEGAEIRGARVESSLSIQIK